MIHGHRVLDAHVHVHAARMMKPEVREVFESGRDDIWIVRQFEAEPATLMAHFEREGVDAAVIVNYVSPDVMGYPPETNDWVVEYTRGRGRLVPMGGVHPKATPDVRAETERILALGVRALKVNPAHQLLDPADERLHPMYEIAEQRGIPVTIHTGTSIFPGARNRFTDPLFVDDVAVDFPNLKILLAHAGRPLWYDKAFFVTRRHDNVMLELSGIPPRKLHDVLPRLPEVAHKCVWGSDWPSPGVRSLRKNVEDFLALPGLTDAQKGAILWDNGARVFGCR